CCEIGRCERRTCKHRGGSGSLRSRPRLFRLQSCKARCCGSGNSRDTVALASTERSGGGGREAPCNCRQDRRGGRARPDRFAGTSASGSGGEAMIRVVAPSRLHFGLFRVPVTGEAEVGARAFGGVGLMIEQPGVVVDVRTADSWQFEGTLASRAQVFATRFM